MVVNPHGSPLWFAFMGSFGGGEAMAPQYVVHKKQSYRFATFTNSSDSSVQETFCYSPVQGSLYYQPKLHSLLFAGNPSK